MEKEKTLQKIENSGLVAVIRLQNEDKLANIIEALSDGGVKSLEITMTTPGAIKIIDNITDQLEDDFIVGVGSVLDSETAVAAIHAGAEFVVSPILKEEIIQAAHRYGKVVVPGAFSPNEAIRAWEMGADVVKIFPASNLGPKYLKNIHGPMPQIKLSPTGGVNKENAADYIKYGASFLGVGSALLDKDMIKNNDWDALKNNAQKFINIINKARN
ncbi:MAG: bifunctional 4-hydroxy-2-oxoglutarate aldolase/2-dehydro-3-deoxy-phosphogluconate aldolase [Candidatus Marinimicrobia bacterium]|nr:bifunctional 4-hydroxy-2-oxoglutarate aldolase/2-dehydro-3-deoxy-phosphogluconate aldolase [Candidatus Neomarinimicrobiota bacterium]